MKPFRTPKAADTLSIIQSVASRGFNPLMNPDVTGQLTQSGVAKQSLGGLTITQAGTYQALTGNIE